MALEIDRLSRRDDDMAGAKKAEVRVYRTVDGEYVGEGDPRGAFLAYGIGAEVPAGDVEKYDRFMRGEPQDVADSKSAAVKAYTDEETRDLMRRRQAGDRDAAAALARAGTPVVIHDRLATELADEARVLASADPAEVAAYRNEQDTDIVYAEHEVWRTEDGDLVHKGDPAGATLAYAVGQPIGDGDVDEYTDLGAPEPEETAEEKAAREKAEADAAKTKAAPKSANKATAKPADK